MTPTYQELLSQIAVQRAALEKWLKFSNDCVPTDEISHEELIRLDKDTKSALSTSPKEALESVQELIEASEPFQQTHKPYTKGPYIGACESCSAGGLPVAYPCLYERLNTAINKARKVFGKLDFYI